MQTSNKKTEEVSAFPFVVEFARFASGFAVIIATGLFALHFATTSAGI